MIYSLLKKSDDEDIPIILAAYNQPSVSQFISIDEDNYWIYVTETDNVFFYKIYVNDVLVATTQIELINRVLYMSIVVFPKYQNQGIGKIILKDIQSGKLKLDFTKIMVSVDEKNIASLKLFEKCGFVCVGKDEELFKYVYIIN
ncbi:MAG: GNAT family N-acetyltransferase [Clostridia bacterium]|nr:GNAT family N-acetyltransferase [Clostridia bacterium]